LELERVEDENRKFRAELREAEKWGEDMLRSCEEKEQQWLQERAQLTKPGSEDLKSSPAVQLEEALAAAKAQVKAESIKAEAFQESLAAAREALQKKAREKNAAEAEAAKATEEAKAAQQAAAKVAQQAKQEAENAAKTALEAQKHAAAEARKRANELQKMLEEEEKAKQAALQEKTNATKRLSDLERVLEHGEKAKHDALQEEKNLVTTAIQRANELGHSLEAEIVARKKAEDEVAKAHAIAEEAKAFAEDQATQAALSSQASKDAEKTLVAALRAEAEKAKAQAEKERTRCAEAQAAWKSALATQVQLKAEVQAAKVDAEKAHSSAADARKELDQQKHASVRKCEALEEDIKVLRDDLRKRKKHNSGNAKDEGDARQKFSFKHAFAVFILVLGAVAITACMCQTSCVQSEVRTNFDVQVRIADASEAHQQNKQDASEHFQQGVAAIKAGNTALAARHANRAFKLDQRPEHAILLARVFTDKDLKADALRVLNKALDAAKTSAGNQQGPRSEAHCALHNNAGILLAEMGNAEHAVGQLRKAVSCADGRAFGHGMRLNLANAELKVGQWVNCAEQAKMVAAQQVPAAMQQAAHVSRAMCLFRNGATHGEVVAETRKAVKALPSKESAKSVCVNLEAQSAREFAAKRARAGKARPAVIPYEPRFWSMQ